jgi:hypothetical protein
MRVLNFLTGYQIISLTSLHEVGDIVLKKITQNVVETGDSFEDWGGGGWSRYKLRGPGPAFVAFVFVFLGRIIICPL